MKTVRALIWSERTRPAMVIRVLLMAVILIAYTPPWGARWSLAAGFQGAPRDIILVVDNSGSMKGISKEAIEASVAAVGAESRLGIVSFGDRARAIRPLGPVLSPGEETVTESLGALEFREDFSDLCAGLEIALRELLERDEAGNPKAVILLSDGRIDLYDGEPGVRASLAYLRGTLLPAYRSSGVVLHVVAHPDGDLRLMQELAGSTGKCLLYSDDRTLRDALVAALAGPQVQLSPAGMPAQSRPSTATGDEASDQLALSRYASVLTLSSVAALASSAVALFALTGLTLVIARGRRQEGTRGRSIPRGRSASPAPGLSGLVDATEHARDLAGQITSGLTNLRLDLEDYVAIGWKERTKSRDEQYRMVKSVLLLADHIESLAAEDGAPDRVKWIWERTIKALQDSGIEEIPVKQGERLDGRCKRAGSQPSDLEPGVVLQVTRRGYYTKGPRAEDDVVWRPAEVIVSGGPPDTRHRTDHERRQE